nr:3-isopropylmalate dehydrogenase, chloroplastic [Ipomoea batatas]
MGRGVLPRIGSDPDAPDYQIDVEPDVSVTCVGDERIGNMRDVYFIFVDLPRRRSSTMASQIARRLLRSNFLNSTSTVASPGGFNRSFTSAGPTSNLIRATLFPGDGIGPEIAESVKQGHRSLNLTLRKELNLYANVRPCNSLPGYKTRYDDVNLITIRENTEGEYSGLEHQVVRGVVESLKIITRQASLRVAEYAFHYAKTNGRERCCREVAEKYPEIKYEEVVIDNCCLMNMANPTALLLSGVAMLRHLELNDKVDRIQDAILTTIADGKYRTADLGGHSSTTDFTNAICDRL